MHLEFRSLFSGSTGNSTLAAFDDRRMVLALELLKELAREQQVLLFTCQRREGAALEGTSAVTRLEL